MAGAHALGILNRRGRGRTWAVRAVVAALLIAGLAALPQQAAVAPGSTLAAAPALVEGPAPKLVLPSWYPPSQLEPRAEVASFYYGQHWIGDIGGER